MSKKGFWKLVLSAILTCGLPTGIINGMLAYYSGKGQQLDFAHVAFDATLTVVCCALIITPLVMGIGKKMAQKGKLPVPSDTKADHPFLALFPSNIWLATLAVTLLSVILFSGVPVALASAMGFGTMSGTTWAMVKGAYSLIFVLPANVIGNLLAIYSQQPVEAIEK